MWSRQQKKQRELSESKKLGKGGRKTERSIYILLGNEKGLCREHGRRGFSEYFGLSPVENIFQRVKKE